MSQLDFKFENFQEYFGDVSEVEKQINDCPVCGAKLVFNHLSDYSTLFVQESSHCPECGKGGRKLLHSLN